MLKQPRIGIAQDVPSSASLISRQPADWKWTMNQARLITAKSLHHWLHHPHFGYCTKQHVNPVSLKDLKLIFQVGMQDILIIISVSADVGHLFKYQSFMSRTGPKRKINDYFSVFFSYVIYPLFQKVAVMFQKKNNCLPTASKTGRRSCTYVRCLVQAINMNRWWR